MFASRDFAPGDLIESVSVIILQESEWRAIEKGEEITINYNGDPESLDPLWFPVMSDR